MGKNETHCPHPYKYLMVSPQGVVKPCCRFFIAPEESQFKWSGDLSPLPIYEGTPFHKVRQDMEQGRVVAGCRNCTVEEQAGVMSMRQKVKTREELSPSADLALEGMEIGFSRTCNLACITCNGYFSTKWETYEKTLYPEAPVYPKIKFQWSSLSPEKLRSLRSLKITGGEPLLSKDFYQFIEFLKREELDQNIDLEIFTNATNKPKLSLLENLENFRSVRINLSLDAIEERNDFIRLHSQWSEVVEVARVWRMASVGLPRLKVGFAITVSVLNVLSLFDLYDWIRSQFEEFEISLQWVIEPDCLSVHSLPRSVASDFLAVFLKKREFFLKNHSSNFRHQQQFEDVGNVLQSVKENLPQWKEKFQSTMQNFDRVRKTDWQRTFPEISSLIEI